MGTRVDIAPCKNCTERKVTLDYNCHSDNNCARYVKWLKILRKAERERRRRAGFYPPMNKQL